MIFFEWMDEIFYIYRQFISLCTVRVFSIGTPSLIVKQWHFSVDAILHQGIHDCAVDLSKELTRVTFFFGENDETIIVENIAVQVMRCAMFFAAAGTGTLEKR